MGEVCVMVKLMNVADQSAVAPVIEADAIVDTGAVRSCIPQPLVDRLGLRAIDHTVVESANGHKEAVGVAYGILFDIFGRKTSDDALVLGDEVLIGQTLLEKLDLLVDCAKQKLVPNPAHPDVAVNKLK